MADDKESDGTRRTIKKAVDDFVARAIKNASWSLRIAIAHHSTYSNKRPRTHLYLDQITEDTLLDFPRLPAQAR